MVFRPPSRCSGRIPALPYPPLGCFQPISSMPTPFCRYYGPEFTSRHFIAWCEQRGITLVHIEPGRPMQNGYVESFNGRFRDECLNANWFANLVDAKEKMECWRVEYNSERPHRSLDYRTPAEFARTCSELTSRMAATPPDPPVELSGLHDGARGQGSATPRKTGAPLPAARRRAGEAIATGGSGGMA
jgi:hypothetical protein